jgi:hypothetical protein
LKTVGYFRVPGGQVGRYRRVLIGAPEFSEGEEVVLFLKGRAPGVPFPFRSSTRCVIASFTVRVARRRDAATISEAPDVSCAAVSRGVRSPCRTSLATSHDRWSAGDAGVVALLLMCVCVPAQPAQAYLHLTFSVGSTPTPLKWNAARVRWFATDRGGRRHQRLAVFKGGGELRSPPGRLLPTASIGFQFAGFTSAVPFDDDGISVFGFDAEPDLDRVLGATSFVVDVLTGQIVDPTSSSTRFSRGPQRRQGRRGASICSRWPSTRSVTSSAWVIRRLARTEIRPDGWSPGARVCRR